MQRSVCVYWGDKLPVRVRVEWGLFHVAEPNHSAARPKPLSKLRWFLLAAVSTVINWFSSKGEPAHIMPVFSSLSVLLFFDTMEKFLVLMWFHALIALSRSWFVLQVLSCTFESSIWDPALMVTFHPTVSKSRAAHLQHDTVALCDLSSPLPMRWLAIKNLNSNCPGKKVLFRPSISLVGNILLKYLGICWWYLWSSCGSLWQWTRHQDTMLVTEIEPSYVINYADGLWQNQILCRFS